MAGESGPRTGAAAEARLPSRCRSMAHHDLHHFVATAARRYPCGRSRAARAANEMFRNGMHGGRRASRRVCLVNLLIETTFDGTVSQSRVRTPRDILRPPIRPTRTNG